MKNFVSLLMAICLCLSVCCLFASCGSSNEVVGQGSAPDVYKIEYSADTVNTPLQNITFGKDANGNMNYTIISNYSSGPVSEEYLYINQGGKDSPSYKVYKLNQETNNYEFVEETTSKYGLPHYDYFSQGWHNKNNLEFRDHNCIEVDITAVKTEDSVKDLLEELGCKYYKYQSDNSDMYAVMAVYSDLDIVLYYGTNIAGDGYETKFLVKSFQLDNTDNYADLVK